MVRRLAEFISAALVAIVLTAAAPSPAPAPTALEAFMKGATIHPGLIPIVDKAGKTYLELSTAQFGEDFIETSVPASGMGGFGPAPGEPYIAPARILHFERYGETIVLRWPNTYALTANGSAQRAGVEQSLPNSIVAVLPIEAQDGEHVVISAAPFLGDVGNLADTLKYAVKNPAHAYHIDATKSFFLATKAFPENDVLRVDQTWTSADPDLVDNAPDPRSIEVRITYNLIQAPNDGYVPRVYDPRVGFFSQPLLDFRNDTRLQRTIDYIIRWNFGTRTSSAPANAANPVVYYLSSDIPPEYRQTVRDALLTWNKAFAKVGILNAIKVEQQPSDPSWDSDDIRHNMIRWVDTSNPAYGAQAEIIDDPRTGEEINVGVNFDAAVPMHGRLDYKYAVAPARGLPDSLAAENAFAQNLLRSVVLHESGHDFGLQHNFIAHEAYSARQLQSKSFTDRYGIASSVMEYAPINLWPKGTPQGDYVQLVLGPYDYYAIQYGYGLVPNAPNWTNPWFRFASDEDAREFAGGHSIDPRVQTFNLTNDPLAWCKTQAAMYHGLMDSVNARFPERGMPYDEARAAFVTDMSGYLRCVYDPVHTIGGEYLSRAQRGDPGALAPLTPVTLAQDRDAWDQLDAGLFSEAAWHFNPAVLDTLTYSEISVPLFSAKWAYDPAPHHGVSILSTVGAAQQSALAELFSPIRLQRIDEFSLRYPPGKTMTLTDLFDWTRAGIFGDIAGGAVTHEGPVRRNLQTMYATFLGQMVTAPRPGTPGDAQALARLQLEDLRSDTSAALSRRGLDEMTRAQLESLRAIAEQSLSARATIGTSLHP
ncbi:MAG TPA: zinc-dependent metalloprotease [Candidatus Baltobacteraceae bacterium]|nr:zinc-dependent metalloprotease [Candidatus Baltobacteraceae bacterium]